MRAHEIRNPTKQDAEKAREICKAHGVKHCKLSLRGVQIGRQCERIDSLRAAALFEQLELAGFVVPMLSWELVKKGIFDSTVIYVKTTA